MKCKVKRKIVPLGILLNDISRNHVRNFKRISKTCCVEFILSDPGEVFLYQYYILAIQEDR